MLLLLKRGLTGLPQLPTHVCGFSSVVAWGRNTEGQAGVETNRVVVTRPTPILGFPTSTSDRVVSLAAGKTSSGAVTSSGHAYTWGCGRSGKTGQGASNENILNPTVVESVVNRVRMTGITCGDNHTLFLDEEGIVWSTGENKAGQLGLGTPLPVLYAQHRATLIQSLMQKGEAEAQQQQQQQQRPPPIVKQPQQPSRSISRGSSSSDSKSQDMSSSQDVRSSSHSSSSMASSSEERGHSSVTEGSGRSPGQSGGEDTLRPAGGKSFWKNLKQGVSSSSSNRGQGMKGGMEMDKSQIRGEDWGSRAGSRMHQQLRQRFQEMREQQQQQQHRHRALTLPTQPHQDHMARQAKESAELRRAGALKFTQQSGPAHILTTPLSSPNSNSSVNSSSSSSIKPWAPGSANPRAVLGQDSGLDLAGHCRAAGLAGGVQCTPTRLGRDQHDLAMALHSSSFDDLGAQISPVQSTGGIPEVVTCIAASAKFSVAVTAEGNVWTWGQDSDGALGTSSAWSTSPQRVGGDVAEVIAHNGGASHAVAGASFCLVLCANGKAIVWGSVPGGQAHTPSSSLSSSSVDLPPALPSATSNLLRSMLRDSSGGMDPQTAGRVACGEIPGLPPLTAVAAGAEHALLSDGQRVYVIGKTVDTKGDVVVKAPWDAPVEVHDAGKPGSIRCVQAGMYASALVTSDGDLLMWGRLVDRSTYDVLMQRATALKALQSPASTSTPATPPSPTPRTSATPPVFGSHATPKFGLYRSPLDALSGPILKLWTEPASLEEGATPQQVSAGLHELLQHEEEDELHEPDWDWPGLGSAWPTLVPGLERVQDVRLGGWHCLAIVD